MSKRVLITGSSRGIGKEIARELAAQGWQVAIHGAVESDALVETQRELRSQAYAWDLSVPDRAPDFLNRVLADGPLDALVNNAGIYMPLDFATAGDAAFIANWHRTFAVNFETPVALMRAAVKHFQSRGAGKILNVASRVGFRGEPGAALYAASKAALINITRSLSVELAPLNIGVFGIAPGWVDTAMAREGMTERLEDILKTIPLGRMASPEDCAAAAAFLLSEKAAYLSGEVIDINGASYFH